MEIPLPSPRQPRSFLGKFFRTLALALFLLIGLFLLVITFESWRGTRKWYQYKKELEARGENLDLLATAPPPVPDEKNFACHPLIARMFLRTIPPDEDPQWIIPKPARAAPNYEKTSDGPGFRRNDLRTQLKRWSDYYQGHPLFPQASTNATPAEVVRTALSLYDPQIRELLQAMKERPQCHYPLRYHDGPMMLLPHLAHMKGLVTVLQLRTLADLHLGHADKAFEELKLGFFINDTLDTDPLLINLMVKIALDKILWDVVCEGIGLQAWKETHLAWFVDYLAGRNYLAAYLTSMRTERNFSVLIIENLVRGRIREIFAEDIGGGGERALRWMPKGIFYHNLYHVVSVHQNYVLKSVDLEKRMVDKDQALHFDHAVHNMGASPYTIFARLLLPALNKAVLKTAHWQTLGDATMIACAAERYRLANNQWPAKLEDLVPRYLPFLPKDVVNGQPFVYKINGPDSILIYTFGWDEWDNKGVSETKIERGDWGMEIAPASQTTKR